MRTLHALPVLALCVILPLAAVLPASAATPPRGNQTADSIPPQPQPDAAGSRNIYLPTVARGPAARVSAIELTQATQNASQTVPMVAGRPTVARIFLQSAVGLTGQSVTLSATRNGVALAGSPLTRTGAASYATPNRDAANQSTNFLLPTAWLSGNVVLTARVVDGGQSLARTVSFQTVPPLRVTIVPIRYVHAPNGNEYAAPATAAFPASVQRMFPIPYLELRWHTPLTFRGNLTASASNRLADWERLLNVTLALKQSEGAASDTVYMALLPTAISSDNRIYYTGIGTSMRATVNFDTQLTPAHELGHTLGRGHAPCGGVTNADPAYPYAGASIGALGFNTASSTLIDPAETTDLMSYCAEWISDYNYIGMYTYQRAAVTSADAAPAPAGETDGVLVRARLSPGEAAEILPLYALRAPLTDNVPAEGGGMSYIVAFVDSAGAILATHTVAAAAAEEEGLSIQVLSAILPLPAGRLAAVEVRSGSDVLARRSLTSSSAPLQAPVVVAESGALNVTLADDAPKLLRMVQGDRVTTLAMDVSERQIALPTADLPGGDGTLEAITADLLPQPGASTASVAAIALPNTPPVVTIAPPEMPLGGGGVVIAGYAADGEDGMLEAEWFVNGAAAARGPFLQIEDVTTLQPDTVISLRATDSAGQVASATLTLQPIQPAMDPVP